ncbi:NADH dehydrogenase [ubiquinone] 1 alpha subcomplex subunit 8 [Contarinia nasturtii]|uniref:NADH dehydrogenase [ubiquinone] 1 alpha subcomplex subunit 8 n=1 Tax=Contarinia nasturtii TaxID=265458 RepID=UPI0012D4326A|nr:NADH dehydrogenase [ubiquinone] 1 alpha subcomplex subunit 8 [Contarinia nasturtii]
MVITLDHELPTEAELTMPELKLSGPALRAGAFHLGKYCQDTFNEFMLCRSEENDPRKCLKEGRDVTNCSFEFFRLIKKSCYDEFTQYAHCLDRSSADLNYKHCRNTQNVFDKCVLDNFNIERPGYGYFCRAQIVDTKRPKPEVPEKPHYGDVPAALPDDAPRPPAKYGARTFV